MINWPTDSQVTELTKKTGLTWLQADKELKKESLKRTLSCANSVNDLKEIINFMIEVI